MDFHTNFCTFAFQLMIFVYNNKKMMKKILFGLYVLIGLGSCSPTSTKIELTDISNMDTSDFVDIPLKITQKTETDTSYVCIAKAIYKSDTLGIQVSLKKGIRAGIVGGNMDNVFLNGGIAIHSIGIESDQLVSAMATLYGIDSQENQMRNDNITFTCANLNQKNVDYSKGEYSFKIFMESEDDYAELYINFDFTNQLIYFNEKDMEYRKGVIDYLTKN